MPHYGIFDNQANVLRKGFVSTNYQNLIVDVADTICDVTDNDTILNLIANHTLTESLAWDILDYHDFSLAEIPKNTYDHLKTYDQRAIVSTEPYYFYKDNASNIDLLDRHLNTIDTLY